MTLASDPTVLSSPQSARPEPPSIAPSREPGPSSIATPVRRSALALAEALIPGSALIPGANEDTVAAVAELAAHIAPSVAKGWSAAQQVLDRAARAYTGGRSLSDLSPDAREDLMRRWEKDPVLRSPLSIVSTVYKVVHFDRRPVRQALGGRLPMVAQLEQPRWLQRIQPAEEWVGGDIDCEVVVVGTGAGGAVVGRELAARGYAVAFVEEGEHYRRDAFDGSSVRAHQRFFRMSFSVGNAIVPIFVGRLVGGSTAVNGGTCFRTPDWVLDRWCEDIGTDEFAPDAMRPYFEQVETFLGIQPSERRFIGPIADIMERGCDRLGWHHFAIERNTQGCEGAGFCDFGCPSDARRSMNISYIPNALEKGAMVFTGLRADRVLLDGNRAVGISGTTKSGRTVRVRAKAVVLAGGAIPTPFFLLGQGIANRSGQVGRNLTIHPSASFSALFDERVDGKSHILQGYGCDQFLREGMLIMAGQPDANGSALMFPYVGRRLTQTLEQMDHIASFALMTRDTTANGYVLREVGGVPLVRYQMTKADVDLLHRTMIYTGEMCLAAGARRLFPLATGTDPIEGAREFDTFRKAKLSAADITRASYHPLGTCKVGRNPRQSVVGLDHQTHDIGRLFIVDGSTVPGPLGVNPQLTIMAMAARAADRIADRI